MKTTRERLLDVDEVAEVLQVSPTTVRRRVMEGSLPAVRLSSQCLRFRESDIRRYIARHVKQQPASAR